MDFDVLGRLPFLGQDQGNNSPLGVLDFDVLGRLPSLCQCQEHNSSQGVLKFDVLGHLPSLGQGQEHNSPQGVLNFVVVVSAIASGGALVVVVVCLRVTATAIVAQALRATVQGPLPSGACMWP